MILNSYVRNTFWFVVRFVVGGIFVYAGFAKLNEPIENLRAVLLAYPVIPDTFVPGTASVLPWIEFVFGMFLILGYAIRPSTLVLGALLAGFLTVLGISRFVYGFSPEDCGCFGQGGIHLTVSQVLILDSLCLLAAVNLALKRDHPWSLDHWLEHFGDKE